MSTVAERIARLEAMPEEERAELLATNRRDYYEFEEADKPAVKQILEHFGLKLPLTLSSQPTEAPSSGELELARISAKDREWFHLDDPDLSEESRKDNMAAWSDAQRVKQINVRNNGKPKLKKGEQIGLGYGQDDGYPIGQPSEPYILKTPFTDRISHTEAEVPPLPMDRACR
jgi:hypothetical protein